MLWSVVRGLEGQKELITKVRADDTNDTIKLHLLLYYFTLYTLLFPYILLFNTKLK